MRGEADRATSQQAIAADRPLNYAAFAFLASAASRIIDMSLRLNDIGRLQNDADRLIDSLRHHWRQIASPDKTPTERKDIRVQIRHCLSEMKRLLLETDALEAEAEREDRFIEAELRAR